jgi:hypothetical protein
MLPHNGGISTNINCREGTTQRTSELGVSTAREGKREDVYWCCHVVKTTRDPERAEGNMCKGDRQGR